MAERLREVKSEEFQVKREEFDIALKTLEAFVKPVENNKNHSIAPIIYFSDNNEWFDFTFSKDRNWRDGKTYFERELKITPFKTMVTNIVDKNGQVAETIVRDRWPYHPYFSFYVFSEYEGKLYSKSDKNEVKKVEELEELTGVLNFMIENIQNPQEIKGQGWFRQITFNGELPPSVKSVVEGIRQTDRMKCEYMQDEFLEVLNKVGKRYKDLEKPKVRDPEYRLSGRLLRKTPKVKDEKGNAYWLEEWDEYTNGDWSNWEYLRVKYYWSKGTSTAFDIFYGEVRKPLDFGSARETGNVKMLKQCMKILKFMDQKLPKVEEKTA